MYRKYLQKSDKRKISLLSSKKCIFLNKSNIHARRIDIITQENERQNLIISLLLEKITALQQQLSTCLPPGEAQKTLLSSYAFSPDSLQSLILSDAENMVGVKSFNSSYTENRVGENNSLSSNHENSVGEKSLSSSYTENRVGENNSLSSYTENK